MLNIHIYPSTFEYESRILKITKSLLDYKIVKKIIIIALGTNNLPEKEILDQNRIVKRFNIKIVGEGNIFKVIKFLVWSVKIIIYLRNKKINIITAHSLSVLPLCVFLKLMKKSILIYEPHELECESSNNIGIRKTFSYLTEFLLINFVNEIIVVSKNIGIWYKSKYKKLNPKVIYNSPKIHKFEKNAYFREKYNLSINKKIFLYLGVLSEDRGLSQILDVFKTLENTDKVAIFMGYGELKDKIIKYSRKYKNIYYHEPVKPENISMYTDAADFGLLLIKNTCISYDYCMPNKLFQYCMSCLPVLGSNLKEIKEFVEKNDIGIIFNPDSKSDFIDAISKIIINRNIQKLNARKVAEKYCWESQEYLLMKTYKNCIKINLKK